MDNTEAKTEVKREPKKRGKTSSASINKYKAKTYTRLVVQIPHAKAFEYKSKCEDQGMPYSTPLKKGVGKFMSGEMVIIDNGRKRESNLSLNVEKPILITIELHKAEAAEFKQRCKEMGVSYSRVLLEAIEDFLYGEWEG